MARQNNYEYYYKDLDVIPIYNFDKCLKGKLEYMYLSKDGEITEEIQRQYDTLYNEFCLLTSGQETVNYYNILIDVNWLKARQKIVPMLLELYLKTPPKSRDALKKSLSLWKIKVNNENDIKRALKVLELSNNKIKIKELELEEIKKAVNKEESKTLIQQSVFIHKNLGVKPDIYKDSVLHWLAYFDELQKLKKNGK